MSTQDEGTRPGEIPEPWLTAAADALNEAIRDRDEYLAALAAATHAQAG